MRTSDYDFQLPEHLIAQTPPPHRSDSRMMVLRRESGSIEHRHVTDLPDYLATGDLLVLNDTRVLPARVFAEWDDTHGRLELLLLNEVSPGIWEAMHQTRRKLSVGQAFTSSRGVIRGCVHGFADDGHILVRFPDVPDLGAALETEGVPPVPPYIRREGEGDARVGIDRERYQTIYAREAGAVAAPTAGLHFTEQLFSRLEAKGVGRAFVTLHVGPGTFKPVQADDLEDHRMHSEPYVIEAGVVARVRACKGDGRRVVAVGTTCVRTLETAARGSEGLLAGDGESDLFIHPPFDFKVVDVLLTNFHLPCSTLLMLVSAFAGAGKGGIASKGRELVLEAYRQAVAHGYRFYSYGDCMLLI